VLADAFTSDLARELAPDALERFLRYVQIDTQSAETADSFPSTEKQLDLSRLLVAELRAIGLEDVELDDHGYVMATVPATTDRELPTIGFVAHVDTAPGIPSYGVNPQVVRYGGGRLALPGDPAQVLDPDEIPALNDHVGHDLVTSDGTTLLGADDKAGVAEIMAAAAHLVRHPDVEHGPVRLAFTPDEEVGEGTTHFDLRRFGAVCAYTLDGSEVGEIEDETFNAVRLTLTFTGRSTHPGTAKGKLVNAIKLAAQFVSSLPRETLSPETTEEREGYVHPQTIEGTTSSCQVVVLLRDHDAVKIAEYEQLVRLLAEQAAAADPRARLEIKRKEEYRNMKQYLRDHPRVLEAAWEAARREGVEPRGAIIRGGTDGARLSERGLPTPNLYTGGHSYHSLREWACVQDMGTAAATIVHLVRVWAEEPTRRP
jgi:tripeptide aminopeptidase